MHGTILFPRDLRYRYIETIQRFLNQIEKAGCPFSLPRSDALTMPAYGIPVQTTSEVPYLTLY